jgi:hypothetical protein
MPWISLNTTDAAALQTTLRELESDSDRAAGIVGAALVDESLTVSGPHVAMGHVWTAH